MACLRKFSICFTLVSVPAIGPYLMNAYPTVLAVIVKCISVAASPPTGLSQDSIRPHLRSLLPAPLSRLLKVAVLGAPHRDGSCGSW